MATTLARSSNLPPPPELPTNLAGLSSTTPNTYSHFGGNGTLFEPHNNTVTTWNCIAASSNTYPAYYYYSGTSLPASRRTASNYVTSGTNSSLNLWAWYKVGAFVRLVCAAPTGWHVPVLK